MFVSQCQIDRILSEMLDVTGVFCGSDTKCSLIFTSQSFLQLLNQGKALEVQFDLQKRIQLLGYFGSPQIYILTPHLPEELIEQARSKLGVAIDILEKQDLSRVLGKATCFVHYP